MALHGVVFLKDGEKISLSIGERDDEPVFSVPDILPHLSYNVQDERKARDVIKGEELKLLFGNMPVNDENVNKKIKQFVLDKLKKDYGIEEDDFFTAELEVVPAGNYEMWGLIRA